MDQKMTLATGRGGRGGRGGRPAGAGAAHGGGRHAAPGNGAVMYRRVGRVVAAGESRGLARPARQQHRRRWRRHRPCRQHRAASPPPPTRAHQQTPARARGTADAGPRVPRAGKQAIPTATLFLGDPSDPCLCAYLRSGWTPPCTARCSTISRRGARGTPRPSSPTATDTTMPTRCRRSQASISSNPR